MTVQDNEYPGRREFAAAFFCSAASLPAGPRHKIRFFAKLTASR
jgi:hypothetical protein